ncbi:MAG TPA: glucose-1-phosphate thymidylyltransferase [Actinomycetota bacterium]|nr:glucose-1-phosphate thymidylyltransferase [Actinomycetota bacterium]
MKALVLSGGAGTRLRPITHTSAKQLIPVANKPILFYGLEAIRDAGIREVGLVVGSTADEVRAACGDGSAWGLEITYIAQDAPRGLAHAVMVARDFLGDDDFVMYLGDNVLLEGITRFVQEFERHRPNAQIFLAAVPEPERFGVAVLDGDRVTRLVEKPKEHISDLALVGVYLFDPTVHEAVASVKPSWRGELEITDSIQALIDAGRTVRPEMVSGWWKDTGKLEDLLEANRIMLSVMPPRVNGDVDGRSRLVGPVVIEKGAKVSGSVVRGPAIVGEDTIIEDCLIGPNASIYYGCTVTGSEVEDSIIMERCRIEDVRGVSQSLVGKDVEVRRGRERPAMYRLMLGDQSQVEVL